MKLIFVIYILIGVVHAIVLGILGKYEDVIERVDGNDDFYFFNSMNYFNKYFALVMVAIILWPVGIYELIKSKFNKDE